MLCTSILSEVVLGFMLWSGWLGTTPTADVCHAEYAPEQAYPVMPVGTTCPQACVGCPAPVCCPQATSPYLPAAGLGYPAPMGYPQAASPCPSAVGSVEIYKILSLPPHLAACDEKKMVGLAVVNFGHDEKPCSWKIQSVVKSSVADGIEVEITLHADNGGVKEEYKATKTLAFDAMMDVTLTGDQPEPVCVRVVARRPIHPVALAPYDAVWNAQSQALAMMTLPSMPACQPAPPLRVGQIFIPGGTRNIPDPIPVWTEGTYPCPPLPIVPASLTLPAPTPVHRASVRLVYESGKARLSVKSEGMTTECIRMKLEAGVAGAVRLSAGKNRVHLAGTKWKAEADRIELGHDGRMVLTGHVKLMSDKLGVCAAVKADRLCVEVKGGKFEKIVDPK